MKQKHKGAFERMKYSPSRADFTLEKSLEVEAGPGNQSVGMSTKPGRTLSCSDVVVLSHAQEFFGTPLRGRPW